MADKELISLIRIGVVVNRIADTMDEHWGDVHSRLVIDEDYRRGLRGLEQFSHALVVTLLHRASFDPGRHLVRRPRGLESMPLIGIFAQRAKDRPNPIGVTAVRITAVGNDSVDVKGLDAINGTPVLDIKPYFPHFDLVSGASVPEWVDRLMQNYFS